jgi:hypothetical protein
VHIFSLGSTAIDQPVEGRKMPPEWPGIALANAVPARLVSTHYRREIDLTPIFPARHTDVVGRTR